jgi:hypothetical protein
LDVRFLLAFTTHTADLCLLKAKQMLMK